MERHFCVVRAPLKRARVDDAGTSHPIAEEVVSPAPVSGPVPADDLPSSGQIMEVALPESGEMALGPQLPPVIPVVVSFGDNSQGNRAPECPVHSGGELEVRGQPSRSFR